MSLYDRMLNIANIDKESIIKQAIKKTKSDLTNLDYERMCLVYSSYLYENLKSLSCLAYIIMVIRKLMAINIITIYIK